MAYEFHIERRDRAGKWQPILLDEWLAAITTTEDVRPASIPTTARNPAMGAEVSISRVEGDVEMNLPGVGWITTFLWSTRGKVSFKALNGTESASHPTRRKAFELAQKLGAIVCGDEGEVYD